MITVLAPASRTISARARRALLPLFVGGLALAHLFTKLHWYCPIARLTGHPCPTCGLSRATQSFLIGDYPHALATQPLSVVVVPFVVTIAALELGTYVWTGELGRWTNKRPIGIVALVLGVCSFVLWIARFFGLFGGPVSVTS